MLCTNCGKEIPFGGKVCPYCGADKSHDQTTQANALVAGWAVAIIVVCIGLLTKQDVMVTIAAGIVAMVVTQLVVRMQSPAPRERIAPTIQRTTETSTADTKKCPYCAESIKKEAVKCRFCGSDLNK